MGQRYRFLVCGGQTEFNYPGSPSACREVKSSTLSSSGLRRNKTRTTLARRDLPKNSMPHRILQKAESKKARVGSAVSDSDSSVQSSSDTFRCHSFWNWRFFCQIIRCPCEKPSQERGKGQVRGGTDIQSNRTIDPALQDKHNESKHLARHSNKPYI